MNEDITRREALKKGALLGGAALVWVRPSVQTYGMSATLAAQASGTAGCTPGFWKNNPGQALAVAGVDIETTTVGAVFSPVSAPSDTLITALGYGGGEGVAGAERILLRAAVAGYLNSLALGGYGFNNLVSAVNSALASGDRDTMLALAGSIDTENNAGCPIPADESGQDLEQQTIETEQQSDQIFGDTEEGGTDGDGTQESGTEEGGTEVPEAAPSQEPEDSPSENGEQPGKGKTNGGDDE